jgi:hypothetical protein
MPPQPSLAAHEWGTDRLRIVDNGTACEIVVLRGRHIPNRGLSLGNIVVARRGLVATGEWPDDLCAGTPTCRSAVPSSSRVREALRRAYALSAWLEGTPWEGSPVYAAVCTSRRAGTAGTHPLLLDTLWLGETNHLPAWLAGGDALDGPACAAVGAFLAVELPFN